MNTPVNDVRILFDMIAILKPKVHHKLRMLMNELGGSHMVVMTHVFQWLMCVFTNTSICKDITRVIWDAMLIEGSKVLFKATLAMIGMIEQTIMSVKTYGKIVIIQSNTLDRPKKQ